ncbi:MAG: sulfotransferase [Dactylosporangium sp.]|nr:sulfotransferase [Dactylosporangium sp.]
MDGGAVSEHPQPLLLVGAQRSGTTALGHALSAGYADRGGCFTVNGKLFYLTARWIRADDLAARHLRADELCHALARHPAGGAEAQRWHERVESALRAAAGRAAAGGYDLDAQPETAVVREVAAAAYGDVPWGDKYNEYLLDLPYLHRLYPRARWLFVYRHPVEVAASMRAWSGDRPWRPADDAGCELKWAAWNERWLAFRDQVSPDRRLEISYDDICTGDGVARVTRFAGVDVPEGFMARRSPPPSTAPRTDRAAAVWSRLCALSSASLSV